MSNEYEIENKNENKNKIEERLELVDGKSLYSYQSA